MDKTILYLCNGKNPYCKCKNFCGQVHPDGDTVCFHTTNPDYAINGPSDKNQDVRPFFVEDDDYIWEGFIGKGKKEIIQCKHSI